MSHSMENRFDFPQRKTQSEYLQYKSKNLEFDTGVMIRGTSAGMDLSSPLSGKFNEKELLHGLNDRLAGFIEKVHQLEHHNHLLESEIEEIKGKAKPASCLEQEYGPELGKLRELIQDITHQKHQIEIEHQNLEEELSKLRRKHEKEARSRSDAESNIMVLKKDISDAYQAKLQLDKKAQSLVDEIYFLKTNHEAEVEVMFDQIQNAQVTVRAHEFGSPGVTAALRDIRAQLEGHAVSDVQQAGETFRSQFAKLTEEAETKREALKATQQEIQEYRKLLQAKNIELDCAKGTREAMEKQLHDVQDRHKEEIIQYQNTIKELENELINCKFDMSGYLREYQDLLNVKMALDVEILSYRKLLCGEEARLSTMSDTQISLPYIYHQSPVYTLPCLSRPGGPQRRAEPQYKFVEEIITETTREIEMSEFEETGSEETEMGKDEQECTKRDRGGSEEEKDNNKDGGEDRGEQVSDSQQNHVESEEIVVNGDGESPGKVDDEGDKSKEESEETGADNEDNGVDKNTQSKVELIDSHNTEENEQYEKVAENTKEEKEDAARVQTVQKDFPSKPEDLKLEVPVEEKLLKKSEDDEKDAEKADLKDSLTPAQAKKHVDKTSIKESKESDKIQEPSSSVQVKDKAHTLASETVEKTTDFTAEPKSTLTAEAEDLSKNKAQKTSNILPKSEGKEHSHSEPKENSQSEPLKDQDKLAKSIQDARDDGSKGQDKEPLLKSDVKSLPEVGDQKPDSGDKIQTVQTMLPKEKTTVTAEVKELHQRATESSQVQKSKQFEGSENINDPQGETEKSEK